MSLTRDQILNLKDIKTKKLFVPEWDEIVYIRQLTRGEQDVYLKRQYGSASLKQDSRAKNQEFAKFNIYGHDAFLCVCGICNEKGEKIFTEKDIKALEERNGEAIGFIANEIVEFSGMSKEVEELEELEETKN